MRLRGAILGAAVAGLVLAACGSSGTRTVVVTRVATTPAGTGTGTGGTGTTGTYHPPFFGPATTPTTPTVTSTSGTLGTAPSRVITVTLPTSTTVTYSGIVASHGIVSSHVVHLTTFRSPTGNIGCEMLYGVARCDILQRFWKPPPHPANCSREVDYGQGLAVGGSGKGSFVCAGDTALDPTGTPLRYGEASVERKLICMSAVTGMTCTNLTDGHGFFISRQRYRIF